MGGTKEGGKQAYLTNIKNNPNHYHEIGRLGGKKSRGGGFSSMSPEKRREAGIKGGRRGGRIGRPGYKLQGYNIKGQPIYIKKGEENEAG